MFKVIESVESLVMHSLNLELTEVQVRSLSGTGLVCTYISQFLFVFSCAVSFVFRRSDRCQKCCAGC